MNTYRKNAIIVGVLFIIATVTNMLGNLSIKPLLDVKRHVYLPGVCQLIPPG